MNKEILKETIVTSLSELNYKSEDLYDEIKSVIQSIPSCYAKGYIDCKFSELNNNGSEGDILLEEITEVCEYDIWND
jgi:hypothetical protein